MRILFGLIVLIVVVESSAQSTNFPLNHLSYQLIESEDILNASSFSSTIQPFSRKSVYDFIQEPKNYLSLEMREYTKDSTLSTKPFLKKLYKYPADLYFYQDEHLDLHVNPIGHISIGRTNDVVGTTYVYTRGIEIRGTIDKKIGFYTYLTENQAKYPEYVNAVRDSTLAVPYEGFWKQFDDQGVDFLRAQGHIDFGITNSISAQFGYGKHFVGNGVRSLILSNYGNNYPYLRVNTRTNVFDYTNIFAELIADVQGNAGGTFGFDGFSKKYMAFHHLNIKIKPNFHIGLFESVMYGDSTGGLKVEYLNPIIFYRAVEQQNGSDDNAIVGLDFKWNIKNRFSLYGQLVIDELIFSNTFNGSGWWGNKQGIQLGGKYANAFGLSGLMLQGEFNRVRPYMYAHEDGFTSFSHYNLSIAHPLGANFTEYLARARYRLNDRWNFESVLMKAAYGNDIGDVNYGRDILKDYTERVPDPSNPGTSLEFNQDHLQGNKTDLFMLFARASYMWKHNVFIDLEATLRKENDSMGFIDRSDTIFGMSFRWNMPARRYLF